MTNPSSGLSEKKVKHVATLARLGLTDKEVVKFQNQLSSILEFVRQLNEIDTSAVLPTSQVTGLENILREDRVKKSLDREKVLENAPDTYQGFFKVKAVLEGE